MYVVYYISKTHNLKDGNTISYTVYFFSRSATIGGITYHWYAGFVRVIADPNPSSYISDIEESFKVLRGSLSVEDASPLNPRTCIESIRESVSASIGLEGPTIEVSTSITWKPDSMSVKTTSIYPTIKWVFKPCENLNNVPWKSSAIVLYSTASNSAPEIQIYLGAWYTSTWWWIPISDHGHFYEWQVTL